MNSNLKIIVAFILFSFTSILSVKADAIDEVAAFLKSGNAKELSRFFAPQVELSILSEEEVYQKGQVEPVLKNFFVKYAPTATKIVHKITSNPNYKFAVVNLNSGPRVFRISISLKNFSGRFLITEMRIEEDSK